MFQPGELGVNTDSTAAELRTSTTSTSPASPYLFLLLVVHFGDLHYSPYITRHVGTDIYQVLLVHAGLPTYQAPR